jgi:hypothetical protein
MPAARRFRLAAVAALVAATALVGVVAGALGTASASALRVDVVSPVTSTATRCTNTVVGVHLNSSAPSSYVLVTGMSATERAACAGQRIEAIVMYGNGTRIVATGTVDASAVSQTTQASQLVDASQVVDALATVNGFALPSAWSAGMSCVVTDGSGDTCTAVMTRTTMWRGSTGWMAQGWMGITTGTGQRRAVAVTADVSAFLGWTPRGWTAWQGLTVQGCGQPVVTVNIPATVTDFTLQTFEGQDGNPNACT